MSTMSTFTFLTHRIAIETGVFSVMHSIMTDDSQHQDGGQAEFQLRLKHTDLNTINIKPSTIAEVSHSIDSLDKTTIELFVYVM